MYKTTQEFNIIYKKIPLGTTHRKTVPQKLRDLQFFTTFCFDSNERGTLRPLAVEIQTSIWNRSRRQAGVFQKVYILTNGDIDITTYYII